jgi:Protein of unknown function (DUF3050)
MSLFNFSGRSAKQSVNRRSEPERDSAPGAERRAPQTGKVPRRAPRASSGAERWPAYGLYDLNAQRATEIDALRAAILPLREQLLRHPIYETVDSLASLRRFMAIHVYAVWDNMCLVKRLQGDFTSLGPLWRPPRHPVLARFVNELVLAEESDLDLSGAAASHVQLYLAAMDEVGAATEPMRRFLSLLDYAAEVEVALSATDAPQPARSFVLQTMACAQQASTVEVLAFFLYGREDLIPEMFSRLLPRWQESRSARHFAYYVERHIQLDGEQRVPLAELALAQLCGEDEHAWQTARRAAELAIRARIALWNGALASL